MKKLLKSGAFLTFLGAFFWSLNAPLIKLMTVDGVVVWGMRSLIAGITLLPALRFGKLNKNRWLAIYFLSYAALSGSVILALKYTDSAIAIGMQYTSIVWLWLYDMIRERRIAWKDSIPILLVVSGVLLFMITGSTGGHLVGNLIAAMEGIFFLGMTISSRKAANGNPLGLTAAANIVTGAMVLTICHPDLRPLFGGPSRNLILILILGVLQVGGGYGFYNMGVQKISAQKASMLALWELILGPVWVAIFLKEIPAVGVIAGYFLVLIGLFLDAFLKKRGDKHENF